MLIGVKSVILTYIVILNIIDRTYWWAMLIGVKSVILTYIVILNRINRSILEVNGGWCKISNINTYCHS